MEHAGFFKECPDCGYIWETREEFLADTELELIGYRADLDDLTDGRIFAIHKVPGCFVTLTVSLAAFWDLHLGINHSEHLAGSDRCPGRCHNVTDLAACDNHCDCAHARGIVQEMLMVARKMRS